MRGYERGELDREEQPTELQRRLVSLSVTPVGRAKDLWIGRVLVGIGVAGVGIALLVKAWLG